jgi:hypothetical protein
MSQRKNAFPNTKSNQFLLFSGVITLYSYSENHKHAVRAKRNVSKYIKLVVRRVNTVGYFEQVTRPGINIYYSLCVSLLSTHTVLFRDKLAGSSS